LARHTGAAYHVNAADEVSFPHVPVRDGDVVEVGDLAVRVVATPGHTFTHLSYVLLADGRPAGVFSGGSLLYGAVGRPDLLGPRHTHTLARRQYASVRRLAGRLPDQTVVYPTHGFGSYCAVGAGGADTSTVGRERVANAALTQDEEGFVAGLLAGLTEWPAYYTRMAALNAAGPPPPDLSPLRPATPAELRRRLAAGEWVVDLRTRTAFAAGHLRGTVNVGLDGSFATQVGWLVPGNTPVTLLAPTPAELAEAQRELVRIGIDRPAAASAGTPREWAGGGELSRFALATFADLAAVRAHRPVLVVDVRQRDEWAAARLADAVHVPLHLLAARRADLPGGEIWVHCASGYRAAIAASMLVVAGRQVVAVDDDFDRAAAAGLPVAYDSAPRHATR
ncbi:rhodanese-like domain-containing protein, partial [Acrocarpospora macrocephala]